MSRVDQARVTLVAEGREIPIILSAREGGEKGAEGDKYRPGGGLPQKPQGGPRTVEDLTVKGEYQPELHLSHIEYLESIRGWGRVVVTEQPLSRNNAVSAPPQVWTGILMGVNRGEHDANSTDTRELELEISTDGD